MKVNCAYDSGPLPLKEKLPVANAPTLARIDALVHIAVPDSKAVLGASAS